MYKYTKSERQAIIKQIRQIDKPIQELFLNDSQQRKFISHVIGYLARKKNLALDKLVVDQQAVPKDAWNKLWQILKRETLSEFHLSGYKGKGILKLLINSLNQEKLTNLFIADSFIVDDKERIQDFLDKFIIRNSYLKAFGFKKNCVNSFKSLLIIINALQQKKTLLKLSLRFSNYYLILKGKLIPIEPLVSIFRNNPLLEHIDIRNIAFKPDKLVNLFQSINQLDALKALCLDIFSFVEAFEEGISAVGQILSNHPNLEHLDLGVAYGFYKPTNEKFKNLSNVINIIKNNQQLKHVGIPFYSLNECLVSVINLINANHTLESISVNFYHSSHIANSLADQFFNTLKNNIALTTIKFKHAWEYGSIDVNFNYFCKTSPNLSNYSSSRKTSPQQIVEIFLKRNRLLKAIQSDPSQLRSLLATADKKCLDDIFCSTLLKSLPLEVLIANNAELIDCLIKREDKNLWAKIARKFGINKSQIGLERVIDRLKQEADQGNASSQLVLGCLYKHGLLKQAFDTKQALAYFSKVIQKEAVANKSDQKAIAHFEIGDCYLLFGRDTTCAISHFKRALELGHPEARNCLNISLQSLYQNKQNHAVSFSDEELNDQLRIFELEQNIFNDPNEFLTTIPTSTLKILEQIVEKPKKSVNLWNELYEDIKKQGWKETIKNGKAFLMSQTQQEIPVVKLDTLDSIQKQSYYEIPHFYQALRWKQVRELTKVQQSKEKRFDRTSTALSLAKT